MPFGRKLFLFAILLALPRGVAAQGIVCPTIDFTTEVVSQAITLRWDDPPASALSALEVSLRKIAFFIPDSVGEEDSISWRGTALPVAGGSYGLGCDLTYKFTSDNAISNFSTVDTARVSPGWTGTSTPISGGTFPSCSDRFPITFVVAEGGTVGPSGQGARVAWSDTTGGSGSVQIPASYAPGTPLPVRSGITVAFTAGTLAGGESFTIATRVPEVAILDWSRPINEFEVISGRVMLCRPDTAVQVEFGLTISLGPGSVPRAEFDGDSVGVFRVSAQSYDGYRVWRSDIRNPNDLVVLREFHRCGSADSLFFASSPRLYHDVEVQNGFPFQYAVTCFDTLSSSESPIETTVRLYPRTPPSPNLADIRAVPNPYKLRAAWEEGGEGKIQFINVPTGTTLRIYTASGSLVREIFPEEISLGCGASALPGCINWDLRNGEGQEIVSGIYIFHAEVHGDSYLGKFMVAR